MTKSMVRLFTGLGCILSLAAVSACGTRGVVEKEAGVQEPSETETKVQQLQESILAGPEVPLPGWAIGPFRPAEVGGKRMIFRPDLNWTDPAGIKDWQPKAFWNPALLEVDGRLYMFYRTGPSLEGLNSRIGLAWSDDGVEWHDYERNPILYPTEAYEARSVEDPRVYSYDGRYYLFYMAVQDREEGGVYADIALATSDDLLHWEKQGVVVPRSISNGWAKSAVIPRSPTGEAVKVDGEFLMYISERPYVSDQDTVEQLIGRSSDLVHWTFEQKAFLHLDENISAIHEVASVTTGFPDSDDMVADVFYVRPDGAWGCGQVLYSQDNPSEAEGFTPYGVCSWGGKILYRGRWLYAQGWLEPESISLYAAPVRGE